MDVSEAHDATPPTGDPGAAHRPEPAADAGEVDVWWGAPATRAMTPTFVIAVLMTAVIAVGAGYLARSYPDEVHWVRYGAYTLFLLLWAEELVHWGYRSVFISYRLTNRRLWTDRGLHKRLGGPTELTDVTGVAVAVPTRMERLLHVGRVLILTHASPTQRIVLRGVYQPHEVAELIRRCVEHARQGKQDPAK